MKIHAIEILERQADRERHIVTAIRRRYNQEMESGDWPGLADSYREALIRHLEALENILSQQLHLEPGATAEILTAIGIPYTIDKGLFYIHD